MLNQVIAKSLPWIPKSVVHSVARRYIAGETLEDAVRVVRELNSMGAVATMDVLGEFVKDRGQAAESTEMAQKMFEAIHQNKLKSGVSVKLTSLGLDIDPEFCYLNLKAIVEKARQFGRFVRIDMENSPYTTRTLDLYRRLRQEGLENVGVVIQARMRRSEADVLALASLTAEIRLCKGIYVEPKEIAFQGSDEIRENYKKLLVLFFEQKMHVGIATHDDPLMEFAKEYIKEKSIDRSRYEFQMLLGVRDAKRNELLKEGYKVRIYVPFGQDWYGYCLRRLKENPQIAGHVMRAFFTGK